MHLKSVSIKNVRSLTELKWSVQEKEAAGWHVIIGDNGTGKSTFVRSIAFALIGPTELQATREDWNDWLRSGEPTGHIRINLTFDKLRDVFVGSREGIRFALTAGLQFVRSGNDEKLVSIKPTRNLIEKYVWGSGKGWFSAGYGPFRRFSGGSREEERLMLTKPKLARHLSLLYESTAFTEVLEWLEYLRFKQLEGKPEGALLDDLTKFVNQNDFLPNGAKMTEVSSDGVTFVDGNGCRIWLEDMSDGYRTVLSMTFELIRQLSICYDYENLFINEEDIKVIVPGVVFIDEVDAHLHPTWQRRIGLWFRKHFPNIQFIVTTHSPLVCQAAEHGTVFKLPTPGTDETGRMITGVELDRLLYGNVLDAYGTGVFGEDVTRSDASKQMSQKLAELNRKDFADGLTQKEKKEQERLRAILPTASYAERKEATAGK